MSKAQKHVGVYTKNTLNGTYRNYPEYTIRDRSRSIAPAPVHDGLEGRGPGTNLALLDNVPSGFSPDGESELSCEIRVDARAGATRPLSELVQRSSIV